jgi:hypothetical protein
MAIEPRGKVTRNYEPKKAYVKIGEPQIEIAAWCRDDNAKRPPEQGHFIIHWPGVIEDVPPMVLRFKNPDTLGFFIEELTRYRRTVWPDCERVKGEIDGVEDLLETISHWLYVNQGKGISATDWAVKLVKVCQQLEPK